MKRVLSLILTTIMVLTVLASCGTTESNPTADPDQTGTTQPAATPNFTVPEGGYDGSEVTLKFYHTMGSNLSDVLKIYVDEFNKLYPNIKIEHEQVGSYDDVKSQISTEITASSQPNLAYCYPDHVAMYNLAGVVANLDSLINSEIVVTRADGTTEVLGLTQEQKDDFISGYYDEGKSFGDGLMYSMPFSKSTEVLYYNKTFFEANNLSVPTTWDEMEALCKKIKEIDPNCVPLGYDSEANWFITMCEQYKSDYTSSTGSHYLFDNETNRSFVARFRDWYQKGYVTTQTLYGSYTSGLFTAASTEINSYMSIGSSAGATHQRPSKVDGSYPFEVGIATIPQIDGENNSRVISQGPSICILLKKDKSGNITNTQEVIASWLFVKYLTTNVDFQAEFSMASGYVPVIKSVSENEAYAAFLEKADGGDYVAALSAKVCLEQQESYYTSPAFNGSSTARDEVGALMAKCLSAAATTDDAAMIKKAFEDAISNCEY